MSQKREKVKLNDKQLEILKQRFQGGGENPIGLLLDHIDAMEAEQRAAASRTASDAFEVGHANATFIERQTQRIQALEGLLKRTLQPLGDADYEEDTSALIAEIEQTLGVEAT